MNDQTKKITYWVLTILIAFVFTASGLFKLLGGAKTAEMAKGLGGHTNLIILGLLELIIVVFWFIPRTGVVAALLAIAYMGGAMAVHFTGNQPILVPLVIEVLIWVAAVIRFPELKQRLSVNAKSN